MPLALQKLFAAIGLIAMIGLAAIAFGFVSWGVRAVAFFALLSLVYTFYLISMVSVELFKRTTDRG